jgi:hypothetical protein
LLIETGGTIIDDYPGSWEYTTGTVWIRTGPGQWIPIAYINIQYTYRKYRMYSNGTLMLVTVPRI